MFLPMSWTSPFTVASTIFPCPCARVPPAAPCQPFLLHERLEVGHRPLHGAGALDDLRQEHLAGAEQVADDLHAVHQRPSMTSSGRGYFWRASSTSCSMKSTTPCTSACDSRASTGAARQASILFLLRPAALDGRRKLDQPLGGVGPAVEDDVLDVLEQILRNVLVHDQLAGIDDAHVEAGLDGVIQKRRVHRFADDIVAAERERQIADAAADLHARDRSP